MRAINYHDGLRKFYKAFSIHVWKPLIYVFCPLGHIDLANKHCPANNSLPFPYAGCLAANQITLFEANFTILIISSCHMLLSNLVVRKTGFIIFWVMSFEQMLFSFHFEGLLTLQSDFSRFLINGESCKAHIYLLWKLAPAKQKIKGNCATWHLFLIRDLS